MEIKTLPRAVACSLGAHGLALALIVMANANGVTPRQTLETVPFIQVSLIYAMNGQSDQKTSPPLHHIKDRTVRTVNKPMESRPSVSKANDKETPEKTVTQGVRAEQAKDMGTDAPVSLHLPSLGTDGAGQIASRGEAQAPGNHLHAGRQGESGKAQAGQMILPRYLNAARPSYPLMARMRGYEGMVLLAVQVLTDGRAGEVRIKKSSGYALLDQSALKAVRAWRFEPARKMDVPLAMTVDIPIRFALNEAD
ncbi:MAG: energy transducer TonB [Proteobacteria bacterium]|nr:energy transducer TonB [Pseudomonadota bacterium]